MTPDDSAPPGADELAELAAQAAAGDIVSLERLLWAHRGRLVGFLKRKIGPDWQGKIDADDVLQEAYIDIFAGIANFKFEDEDSFYRWTTRIIDHRFIDQVRHHRRKKRDAAREKTPSPRSMSRHESFLGNILRESMTPSRAMRREDAVNALMTCIAKLPEDWRVVVQRYHINEEPLDRIAADMGRTEDAVRRLASRAVERLGECLKSASRYLASRD